MIQSGMNAFIVHQYIALLRSFLEGNTFANKVQSEHLQQILSHILLKLTEKNDEVWIENK